MRLFVSMLLVSALVIVAGIASAQPGPEFKLGFRALADQIPDIVGEPLGNEHHNPINGDGLQQTTRGLMVWRKADNWTAFTDGARTWVSGPFGIVERSNEQRFEWEAQERPSPLPTVALAPVCPPTATPRPTSSPTATPIPIPTPVVGLPPWVWPTPLPSPGPIVLTRKLSFGPDTPKVEAAFASFSPLGSATGWVLELSQFPELTPGRRLMVNVDRVDCGTWPADIPEGRRYCSVSSIVFERLPMPDGSPYQWLSDPYGNAGPANERLPRTVRRAGYPSGSGWRAEPGGPYIVYLYTMRMSPPQWPPVEFEVTVQIAEW